MEYLQMPGTPLECACHEAGHTLCTPCAALQASVSANDLEAVGQDLGALFFAAADPVQLVVPRNRRITELAGTGSRLSSSAAADPVQLFAAVDPVQLVGAT